MISIHPMKFHCFEMPQLRQNQKLIPLEISPSLSCFDILFYRLYPYIFVGNVPP